MSSINPDLEHRLTKIESLHSNIETYIHEDRTFHTKLEDKLDGISIKIEGLRFYEKTIEKMETQVVDHEKKIERLFTYIKVLAGIIIVASGGSASLVNFLVP